MMAPLLLSNDLRQSTIPLAAAKSVAEIGVSKVPRSRPTLPLRGFLSVLDPHLFGSCWPIWSAAPAVLWRFERGHRKVRRDLWGAGYANLVRAATILRLASSGGREKLTLPEAAIMATVPTRAISSPSQAWLSCVQNDTPTHCDLLFDELEQRIDTIDLCSFDRRQITALLHTLRTEVSLLQEAV